MPFNYNSIKLKLASIIISLTIIFAVSLGKSEEVAPKVLIFYSSIGMGHISASRAIENKIKERNPNAIVILKNIRDFINPSFKERCDEKLFWYIVKNYPNFFDKSFQKAMKKGNEVQSLNEIKNSYDADEVYKYIAATNPTSIIATHYGSAKLLGDLRDQHKLTHIPIGWLHTDYFEGYFPRISERLEMTFLGMPQMEQTWEKRGVDPSKVISTGLPVNPALFVPIDREAFLKSKGLNPNITTIVLASGGEGVGNFPLIVKEVFAKIQSPIQFVAVCANNKEHFATLTKMIKEIRSDSKLVVTERIPNEELLSFIKASDLFITKSGGLSPTEGFAITKPMVLLDVYGGHERENANLFEKEGFAIVNRDQSQIGSQVLQVLNDKELQQKMIKQQLSFRNSFNLDAITDFAFNPKANLDKQFSFGVEGGETVTNADQALTQLEKESPAQIEVILSYGKSYEGKYFKGDANPFGHLAVRINDKVYTANGRAELGVEPQLIHSTSLKEYLFGVKRPYQNVEHTDAFGSAYGRKNLSLRVRGVSNDTLQLMNAEIIKIESEWKSGSTKWNARKYNCADFVARILKAAGINPVTELKMGEVDKGREITMPLDVFEGFRRAFESNPNLKTELVMYSDVPDAKNIYKTTRFVLSINQLGRSLKNLLSFSKPDKIETMVGKIIEVEKGKKNVTYRNLNQISSLEIEEATIKFNQIQTGRKDELNYLEQKIESLNKEISLQNIQSNQLNEEIKKQLNKLTEEQLSQLFKSLNETSFNDDSLTPSLNSLLLKIQKWNDFQMKLEFATDNMIKLESDYLIDETLFSLMLTQKAIIASGNLTNLPKYNILMKEAMEEHLVFKNSKENYGGPKDGPTRTVAFRKFFLIAKQMMDLQDVEKVSSSKIKEPFYKLFSQKTKNKITVAKLIVKIIPQLLNFLFQIGEHGKYSLLSANGTGAINELSRKIATQLGIKVKVKNSQFLPFVGPVKDKKVYIVTPTHRDPLLDTLVMGAIGLDKSMLVLATDQIIPKKSIADRIDKTDNLITVGRGSGKPIEKIIQQLAIGKTNTVLIYPEGSVSIGLSETRPLRERFASGLIESLQANGYDVNIVPITYENTSQFVFSSSLSSLIENLEKNKGVELIANVHPVIDNSTIKLLSKTTGTSSVLNRLIRSIWLETFPSDDQRLLGILRPETAMSLLNNVLVDSASVAIPKLEKPLTCKQLLN